MIISNSAACVPGEPLSMPQELFDRVLIRHRRSRIARLIPGGDFLLAHVAEDLADRVQAILREFKLVVDLGAHHGILSERLDRLENVGTLVQLDSAPELLDLSQGLRVCCDEEFLPLKSGSVDLLVSGLVLQYVNDLPGTMLQIRRSLKPDGLFLGSLLGGQTLHELRTALMMAEEELEGGSSPRVAPFADVQAMGSLLQRAGFALPVIDSELINVTYPDPLTLMHELRAMGGGNALFERRKTFLRRATLMRACEIYCSEFGDENGRIPASFEIITLTGWSPHESQQKPLRPGSATQRLADVLGVEEISAGEKAGLARKK